jgi:hypothetical protein
MPIARRSVTFLAGVILATLAILALYAIGQGIRHDAPAPITLSTAQGDCLGHVMTDVMTNEPEYPGDIVTRADAVCGIKVIVSIDPDGEINALPTAISSTTLTGLR